MKRLVLIILSCAAVSAADAASFIQQGTFGVSAASVKHLDRDSVGNLYVLGLILGSTASYSLASYQMPDFQPLLGFTVPASTPVAFAVESNGIVDVLDSGNAFTLTRFQNTGEVISQTSRINSYMKNHFAAAIDKTNSLIYISYPSAVIKHTGDFSFVVLYNRGAVDQYDFQGRFQRTFFLPGRSDISTTCYTPSLLSVDDQGSLWVADPNCHHLLSYSPAGTLLKDVASAFPGTARGLWTGPGGSVFVAESVCDSFGCPHGAVLQFDEYGATENYLLASSTVGFAWDSRILYLGSSNGSSLQRYILNSPPAAPVQSSPLNAVVQHSSSAILSWQAPDDSEGDPLLYSVYLGTAPGQLSPIGSASQTSFTSQPLAFGATYYWRVAATDSYLGLPLQTSTSSALAFNLNLTNRPPADFGVKNGAGAVVTRDTAVNLSWEWSLDPDGDGVTYTLSWWPIAQASPTVIVTTSTSQLMTGLSFGSTYFWSVVARDGYGATRPMAGGATQAYLPVFENTAPTTPLVSGGAGVVSQHSLSPQVLLSWSNVVDPDLDDVNYRLRLGTAPEALALVQDSTATAYDLSPLFGTTYYWQATAYDPFGALSTTPVVSLLTLFQNQPPAAFAVLSGTGAVSTRDASWPLAWQPSTDADGDLVNYEFFLSTSPNTLAVVRVSTDTSYLLTLQFGATYYWQAVARDGFGGQSSSGLQSIRAEFLDDAPEAPELTGPFMASPTVKTMRNGVEVAWNKVTNPQGDPITYTAYLGESPADLRVVTRVEQSSGTGPAAISASLLSPRTLVQDDGNTVRLLLTGLDYYKSYFLKVTAETSYGAASQTPLKVFSLTPVDAFPRAYNYPNPFSPSRGGTRIVFNAPASGYARATVWVYSEFQELLFHKEYVNIPPGISETAFDGRDKHGRALFNGSYICRVRFEGPEDKATFYLMVVK